VKASRHATGEPCLACGAWSVVDQDEFLLDQWDRGPIPVRWALTRQVSRYCRESARALDAAIRSGVPWRPGRVTVPGANNRSYRRSCRGLMAAGVGSRMTFPQFRGTIGCASKRQAAPPRRPESLAWAFMLLRCASPFSCRCGRVAIHIPLAPGADVVRSWRERTVYGPPPPPCVGR